jgi:hypothetical protein
VSRHFIPNVGYHYDDDGDLVDAAGEPVYCENQYCDSLAEHVVPASSDKAHDGVCCYCEACVDVYFVGVQHGRYHEAACHGEAEFRDNSPMVPPQKEKES